MKPFTADEARKLALGYDPPEWLKPEARERNETQFRPHFLIAAALRHYANTGFGELNSVKPNETAPDPNLHETMLRVKVLERQVKTLCMVAHENGWRLSAELAALLEAAP